jgi:hypothetical protein
MRMGLFRRHRRARLAERKQFASCKQAILFVSISGKLSTASTIVYNQKLESLMTHTFLKTPLLLSAATAALLLCGATTGLAQTLPSYESNGFPITPLQAQAVSPKGMQERLSDPTLAGGSIQPSPHQAAVFGTRNPDPMQANRSRYSLMPARSTSKPTQEAEERTRYA